MDTTSIAASHHSELEMPLQFQAHVVEIIHHKIRKVQGSDKMPSLCIGPHYKNDCSDSLVDSTFEYIISKSPGDPEETKQAFKEALNNTLMKKAKLFYPDDDVHIRNMPDGQFQSMMIKHGCALLFRILKVFGYFSGDEEAFASECTPQSLKEYYEFIFFPGNQICNLVLQKLLEQPFFKQIIENTEWRRPRDLCQEALYASLLKPNSHHVSLLDATKAYIFNSKKHVLENEPSDVLDALHMLVVHGKIGYLCSPNQFPAIRDEPLFSTATELNTKGISSKGVEGIGIRGIEFNSNMFGAVLSMPVIPADDQIGLVFQVLKDYESTPNFAIEEREVTSYLGLLKDLIRTIPDTNMLARKGVIEDDLIFRNNFTIMLRDQDSSITCEHIKYVKLQASDYSRVNWPKLLSITFKVIACFCILQTVYSILQYYKKPNE